MTVTVSMRAPAGFGGAVTSTPSGTVYNVPANGLVSVQQLDVPFFLSMGFAFYAITSKSVLFEAPLPADLISIKAAATPANGAIVIAAQPPHARKLQIRIVIGTTTTTAITAGTLTLVGFDQDGNAITEVISLIQNASATLKTANAFASLTSGTVANYAAAGSGTGNTLGIGVSNDFGVPGIVGAIALTCTKATKVTKVLGMTVVAADDVASTVTVDAVARTLAPTTAPAASGLIDFSFNYTFGSTG